MATQIFADIDTLKQQHKIVFHIAQVDGLPPRSGWNARPGTSVSLQVGPKESYSTENKRLSPGSTAWSENLPQIQMTSDASVQFQLKTHKMLAKRKVLGISDTYNIEQLLKMQGDEPDGLLRLPIVLDSAPRSPPNTPKTPRSPRTSFASFRTSTTTHTFLDAPNMLSPSSPNSPAFGRSPSNSPPLSPQSPKFATLVVGIRETPVDPEFNLRVNAANLKAFIDKCRSESLNKLHSVTETIKSLAPAFEDDNSSKSLIDLAVGALKAADRILAHPDTTNINRHIIHIMKAMDQAFSPYQCLSQRQLEKRGESSIALLQEMLQSVLSTVCIVDSIFMENDAFARDRLESKLINWVEYFQQCGHFLDGHSDQRPALPSHRSVSRLHCHRVLDANSSLPKHNVASMALPEVDTSNPHQSSNTLRQISEWIFTPIPEERQVTPKPSALSYAPKRSGSISPSSLSPPASPVSTISSINSPRSTRKPSQLVLKSDEDSFPESIELKSILKSPLVTDTPLPRDLGFSPAMSYIPIPNDVPAKEFAAFLSKSLSPTKHLGGYFSFEQALGVSVDASAPQKTTPQSLLDALPLTLVHQLASV